MLVCAFRLRVVRIRPSSGRSLGTKTDTKSSAAPGLPYSLTHDPYLVVASIGNPEITHHGTRHSVGHSILASLLQHYQAPPAFREHPKKIGIEYATAPDENNMLFVRTQSYMNVSGAPISRIWNAVKQSKLPQVSSLVVIHDELSIPVGKVQVRKQFTSARGHNGLRSISENIGGGYTKIGIGIGKPTNGEVADYVLTRFNKQDLATIEMDTIPQVVSIIEDMKMGRYIYEVSENIMGEEKKKKKKAKKLRKIDLEMEGPGA